MNLAARRSQASPAKATAEPSGAVASPKRYAALRIVGSYFFFSAMWILFSDWLLAAVTTDPTVRVHWSLYKGWAFVLVTALLLYALLRAEFGARHRATEALRRSQTLLQSVAEGTPDAVYVKDTRGRYLLFNTAACHFVGQPRNVVLGNDDTALFPPDDAQRIMDDDRSIMESGETRTGEESVLAAGLPRVFLTTKGPIRDDHGAVIGLFGIAHDITERKRTEATVRESETTLRAIWESMHTGLAVIDPDTHTIVDVNPVAARLVGRPKEHIVGSDCRSLLCQAAPGACPLSTRKGATDNMEETLVNAAGEPITIVKTTSSIVLHGRRHILESFIDITAFKRLEEQIRQAQRIEAVGRLAGGVAHDFNNMLQTMLGYSEILLAELPAQDSHRQCVLEIQKSAKHAAELTRQLLAFSRKQMITPSILDLNTLVTNTQSMLQRLLGEDIALVTHLDPSLHRVRADASQIEQVIVNLAVNARDAMPHGGRLTLSTANAALTSESEHDNSEKPQGDCVCLAVTDTGTGMSRDIQEQIFEPFFSTKGLGKGTGLGLSVIYGIAKQHHGWIRVDSHIGKGSTFTLVLPACHDEPVIEPPDAAWLRTGRRILLVEDEPAVCRLSTRVLATAGYDVVAANDAATAMDVFEREQGRFDLFFSDVVLPDRSGIDLAEMLLEKRPDLAVLLCSGYTDERSRWAAIVQRGFRFLQKPYSSSVLLSAVHAMLAARSTGTAEGTRGGISAGQTCSPATR